MAKKEKDLLGSKTNKYSKAITTAIEKTSKGEPTSEDLFAIATALSSMLSGTLVYLFHAGLMKESNIVDATELMKSNTLVKCVGNKAEAAKQDLQG